MLQGQTMGCSSFRRRLAASSRLPASQLSQILVCGGYTLFSSGDLPASLPAGLS